MSHITAIDPAKLGAPILKRPPADRIISGNPDQKSWPVDKARDGSVLAGMWECEPGEWHVNKGTSCEWCYLLEGVVELTDTDGSKKTFKAGDAFLLKDGWVGVWKTVEKVRKYYVVVQ
jgi:uncharacterized cupin superfamily protein